MSPGQDQMFLNFEGIVAVTMDGTSRLDESQADDGIYTGITSGTLYLVIKSVGYWELRGK